MPSASFNNHIAALAVQAGGMGQAAAAPGLVPRPWQIPPAAPGSGTEVQDPAFWAAALARADLNAGYVAEFATAVPVRGRAMAYKAAADYMGAYERAVQARYASAVRCRVWAGARRAGHSDLSSGVLAAVVNQLGVWAGTAPAAAESELSN